MEEQSWNSTISLNAKSVSEYITIKNERSKYTEWNILRMWDHCVWEATNCIANEKPHDYKKCFTTHYEVWESGEDWITWSFFFYVNVPEICLAEFSQLLRWYRIENGTSESTEIWVVDVSDHKKFIVWSSYFKYIQ